MPPILEAISCMSAIEILVNEHRLISRMVSMLAVLHKRLESNDHADVNVPTDVVDFFRMFVDRNHHAKEEDALFPTLERCAVNPEGSTIQSLKNEHEQARILTATLTDAIGKYKTGDATTKSKIYTTITSGERTFRSFPWRLHAFLR